MGKQKEQQLGRNLIFAGAMVFSAFTGSVEPTSTYLQEARSVADLPIQTRDLNPRERVRRLIRRGSR